MPTDWLNQAPAALFMVATLAAAGFVGRWLLSRIDRTVDWLQSDEGPVERFIETSITNQAATKKCLEEHAVQVQTAHHRIQSEHERIVGDVEALRRAGLHACDVLDLACRQAGINGDVAAGVERVRRELQDAHHAPSRAAD